MTKHLDKREDVEEKEFLLIFLHDVKEIKDNVRNLLLHGKIDEFISDTVLGHNAVNVFTMKKEILEIKYNEAFHGKNKGLIKDQRVSALTHTSICLFSIAVHKLNKYIDFSEMSR